MPVTMVAMLEKIQSDIGSVQIMNMLEKQAFRFVDDSYLFKRNF